MSSLLRSACVALALLFPVTASGAAPGDTLPKGPKVGEHIPRALDLPDQTGHIRSLPSLLGERGLVLLFYRSLEMCPPCELHMRKWNAQADTLDSLGYGVATITNDSVESLARVTQRSGAALPLLSDPKAKVIKAFGLLDEKYPPGSAWYGTPHPMIFVVDRHGAVTHRYSTNHHRDQPDIGAIIGQLRNEAGG